MLGLPEPDGHGDVSEFDRMVAGDMPTDRSVAPNGQIIERQQILTTHKPGSPGEARRAARILDDLALCLQDEPVTPFTGWTQSPHWVQSTVPETDTPKLVEPIPERQRRARVETTLNTRTSPEAPSSGMLARARGINSIGRVPPLQGGS